MKYIYQQPQTDVMDLTLCGEVLGRELNNSVVDAQSNPTGIETGAPARKLYI